MFIKTFIIVTLFSLSLFCASLTDEYSIEGDDFNASIIYPEIKNDFLIYRFDVNRHRKSFRSSVLIQTFKEHGVALKDDSNGIVHVKRASSANMQPVIAQIKAYYLNMYPEMKIKDIDVRTNGFIDTLPPDYTLSFKPNAYLYSRSTLQIISESSKLRHFISYELDATITLFKARHNINRGKILTPIDLVYEDETFTRLKGTPFKKLSKVQFRLKKQVHRGKIVYEHDLEKLPAVIKDKSVNVRLISGKVHLEFIAKSLQDGYIDDQIYILKTDGKRLRAKVIDRNLVEIE